MDIILKRIVSMLLVLCCGISLLAQQVGHLSMTFTDASRSNRQIPAEVYYPATATGNNTPLAPGTFPLVVFGHGFVMTWSAYQNIWDALVPEGYIVVFPTTETGLSPSHAEFGADLKFLIGEIQQNGAGAIIPATKVAATSAIMGHSMGGGCSFLAGENNSGITTMVTFAAANTNPSSITAAQQVSAPTLIFSGSNDCVAPPAQHQDIMYDSTVMALKTQIYIPGGGHCYFANSNFNCSFGESTCSPAPTITRTNQQSIANDFLKIWLAYFLKGDCTKAQEFQDSLVHSSRINFRQNQPISCITGIPNSQQEESSLFVYPNPSSDKVTVYDASTGNQKQLTIQNVFGEIIWTQKVSGNSQVQIDLTGFLKGIYFLRIERDGQIRSIKIMRSYDDFLK